MNDSAVKGAEAYIIGDSSLSAEAERSRDIYRQRGEICRFCKKWGSIVRGKIYQEFPQK